MTTRERELVEAIEVLPRAVDAAGQVTLEPLPIMGVLHAAHRLNATLLGTPPADRQAATDLHQLLHQPDSIELAEQRRSRTGVDWHDVLVVYCAFPGAPIRRLVVNGLADVGGPA